jgi:hypothetical protein
VVEHSAFGVLGFDHLGFWRKLILPVGTYRQRHSVAVKAAWELDHLPPPIASTARRTGTYLQPIQRTPAAVWLVSWLGTIYVS